jgi:hypothetical protein
MANELRPQRFRPGPASRWLVLKQALAVKLIPGGGIHSAGDSGSTGIEFGFCYNAVDDVYR